MDDLIITRVIVGYSNGGAPQYIKMENDELTLSHEMKGALLFEPKQAEAFIQRAKKHTPGKFVAIPVQ